MVAPGRPIRVPAFAVVPHEPLHTFHPLWPVRRYPHLRISVRGPGPSGTSTHLTRQLPGTHYADASDQMLGKRISLYRLELPNAEYDTNGFIKHILVRLHLLMPHAHQGELRPVFAEGGDTEVRSLFSGASNKDVFQVRVETLYDRGGNAVLTLKELTSGGF